MASKLSVNLNAVAYLRNRRELPWPNLTDLGRIALTAGAAGITIHPRPDQRHIRFSDIPDLKSFIKSEFPDREFNIEGYPSDDFVDLVLKYKPEQVTLVPDKPGQITSDHGWDFKSNQDLLTSVTKKFQSENIRVSSFADPDPEQVPWAKQTGCDRIELYTGPYGGSYNDPEAAQVEIEKLGLTADAAVAAGLELNAGHDLTVENLPALLQRIPQIAEVSIGHGLISDALLYGMDQAVRRFIGACKTNSDSS